MPPDSACRTNPGQSSSAARSGLLGRNGGKYGGRVGLLAVCATGWIVQGRRSPGCRMSARPMQYSDFHARWYQSWVLVRVAATGHDLLEGRGVGASGWWIGQPTACRRSGRAVTGFQVVTVPGCHGWWMRCSVGKGTVAISPAERTF